MTDHFIFKKTIEVGPSNKTTNGPSMMAWTRTLPIEEQNEWNRVHLIHESVVNQAITNGDAKIVVDETNTPTQILWRSEEIHLEYIKKNDRP